MAAQPTIAEMIDIGNISGPLAALYADKKSLYGGSVIRPIPPLQITIIKDILKWAYEGGAETDATLRTIASYGYWMWGKFGLEAQNIINGPGGGSVVPTPTGGGSVNDLDFIVSASSIIATGESSIYFDGTGGNPDFRGMNLNFARNGTEQYTTNPTDGSQYFAWNKVTGFFQLLPLGSGGEALVGDRMRIMPDTGPAASSATAIATSVTVLPGQWADAVTLNLQYIVDAGEVALFVSGYNSNFLIAPTDFTYTAGGLVMTDINFNSANFPFTLIMKIN